MSNDQMISRIDIDAALQAHGTSLVDLFRQAPGFIATLPGPEHVFGLVNDAYEELVGCRDLSGLSVRQAFPEITGQGFSELLDQVYATGQLFEGKMLPVALHRTPMGEPEIRHVSFIYKPIRDADGAVTGVFIQGHGVTEQKRAEEQLQSKERWVRAALGAAAAGIAICTAEGRYIDVNPAYCSMFAKR